MADQARAQLKYPTPSAVPFIRLATLFTNCTSADLQQKNYQTSRRKTERRARLLQHFRTTCVGREPGDQAFLVYRLLLPAVSWFDNLRSGYHDTAACSAGYQLVPKLSWDTMSGNLHAQS